MLQPTQADVSVTILDAASVYEGQETVYRYDLTGQGIIDGWATESVLEQIAAVAGPSWPESSVSVTGASEAVEVLERVLSRAGVQLVRARNHVEVEPPPPVVVEELPLRAQDEAVHEKRLAARIEPLHVAIVAVVLVIGMLSWWVIGKSTSPAIHATSTDEVVQSSTAPPSRTTPPSRAPATPTSTSTVPVFYEYEQIRVQLPPGFHLATAPDDPTVIRATGPDENLRVLMSIDPVSGLDSDALRAALQEMIAADPTLQAGAEEQSEYTMQYTEEPGDGSVVEWVAKLDGEHLISVGCHSKFGMSIPQRATCTMAQQSAALRPAPL